MKNRQYEEDTNNKRQENKNHSVCRRSGNNSRINDLVSVRRKLEKNVKISTYNSK